MVSFFWSKADGFKSMNTYTLFNVSDNTTETGFLFFDSLCYQVIPEKTDWGWQILRFNPATRKILVWAGKMFWDLPTKEFFEWPEIEGFQIIVTLVGVDVL